MFADCGIPVVDEVFECILQELNIFSLGLIKIISSIAFFACQVFHPFSQEKRLQKLVIYLLALQSMRGLIVKLKS